MSFARRSASVLNFAQKRAFRARPAKNPLPPPYKVKESFDYSEIEPIKNYEKACVLADSGANYEKFNSLGNHYTHQEEFVNHNGNDYYSFYGGMYGPFWPAHFGGGYLKFLRRRNDILAKYNYKNPFMNFYRRKCDERGIFCEFPRGQDYQLVLFWFLGLFTAIAVAKQLGNFKAHFANAKPLPPPDDYPARINLPFYVYVIHEIPSPNFEA